MFLGTFLIGLREGLEATLIVGIIAAFLKRNGRPLRPMMIGVAAAVLLSIAVGVTLQLLSRSLPQAQQEALETVIGVVAIVFVTTMILWMNHHARFMKRDLEHDASSALNSGGAWALAGMAFLAVLKEGFETAVFLLAAIQASASEGAALGGAVVGILVAVAIGAGIYVGGLRLDLRMFFQLTGVFLVFVAAGLVMSALRTAHEAGWVVIGQQQVADFSTWMPKTSVLAAVVTGMFGIPTDPRLIEVLGWLAYLVPVLTIYFWPQRYAVPLERRPALKRWLAAAAAVVAVMLLVAVPRGDTDVVGDTRRITADDGGSGSVTATVTGDALQLVVAGDVPGAVHTLQRVSDGEVDGVPVTQWETTEQQPASAELPRSVTLAELQRLNGGRLPSGLNAERTPGPFAASWSQRAFLSARTSGSALVTAEQEVTLTATLVGGGVSGEKTVSVSGAVADDWSVPDDEADDAQGALEAARAEADERTLWWVWVPAALVVTALALATSGAWDRRRARVQELPGGETGDEKEAS